MMGLRKGSFLFRSFIYFLLCSYQGLTLFYTDHMESVGLHSTTFNSIQIKGDLAGLEDPIEYRVDSVPISKLRQS